MKKIYRDFINENWEIEKLKDGKGYGYIITNTNNNAEETNKVQDEQAGANPAEEIASDNEEAEEDVSLYDDPEAQNIIAKFMRRHRGLRSCVKRNGLEKYFSISQNAGSDSCVIGTLSNGKQLVFKNR